MPVDKMLYEDIVYRMESLIVFSNVKNDPVVQKLIQISNMISCVPQQEGANKVYYEFISLLVNKAEELGLSGNIFSKYMVYLFLNDENAFSIACEKNINIKNKGLFKMAKKDFSVLYFFKTLELRNLCENVGYGENIVEYESLTPVEHMSIEQVMFAEDNEKMIDEIIWCYRNMGVGNLAYNYAFTVSSDKELIGVKDSVVNLSDIIGLEVQKEEIKQNTINFIEGADYESILLWGSSGMGKSAIVHAIANEFFEKGVRVIELNNEQLHLIPELIDKLCNRGKKIIFFIRKLTYKEFAANEIYLKYILNIFSNKTKNVLLYATSSYTKEDYSGDLEGECKLLVDRFSFNVYFSTLSKEEYLSIVLMLAKKAELNIPEDFLKEQAMRWALDDKDKSIYSAKKFIKYITRELNKK